MAKGVLCKAVDFVVESRSSWLRKTLLKTSTGVGGWRGFAQEVKGCRGMVGLEKCAVLGTALTAGARGLLCSCMMQTGGKAACNVIVFIDPLRRTRGRISLHRLLH